MKKLWALIALAVAPFSNAASIGVIDIEAVLSASDAAEEARANWQQELAPIQAQIAQVLEQGRAAELRALDNTLNQAEREQAQRQQRELRIELADLQREASDRLGALEQSFLTTQLPRLESLVIELAESNRLDLVIHADSVIWGVPAVNLSDDLLNRFNALP